MTPPSALGLGPGKQVLNPSGWSLSASSSWVRSQGGAFLEEGACPVVF